MSTLELENIKHPDNSGNNIELAADGSIGSLNLSGNVGIGTNTPLTSPAGAFSWANPIATIEGSRPTLYLNSSGSLATIRMWPSGTDGSSTTVDDFHINAIATSGSTPGSWGVAAQGGALGFGLSVNSNNMVTTPDNPSFQAWANAGGNEHFAGGTNPSFGVIGHNTTNSFNGTTFTAPIAGRYLFSYSILSGTSGGYGLISLNLNGAPAVGSQNWSQHWTNTTNDQQNSATQILNLAANDEVNLYINPSHSRFYWAGQYSKFCGYLIG